MAPHTSGFAVRRWAVDSCKWGPRLELTGLILDTSPFRGDFSKLDTVYMICMCIVLTFQTLMVPCIYVNCFFVVSGEGRQNSRVANFHQLLRPLANGLTELPQESMINHLEFLI